MVPRFTSRVSSLWSTPFVAAPSTTPGGLTKRITAVCEKILAPEAATLPADKAELEDTWKSLEGRVTPLVRSQVKEAAAIAKADPKILREIEMTDLCDRLIVETYRTKPLLTFKELEVIGERLREYLDDDSIPIGSNLSKEIERAAGFLRDVKAKWYPSEVEPTSWLDVHRYNYTRTIQREGPYVVAASAPLTHDQLKAHAAEQLRLWEAVKKNPEIDVARQMLKIAEKVTAPDRSPELSAMITEITARLELCNPQTDLSQYRGTELGDSQGIDPELDELITALKNNEYLAKSGAESLDKKSRAKLEEIFKLPKKKQALLLINYSKSIPFLYEFALKSVIRDTATLLKNVKDKSGKVTDEFAKEYETYALYVQFAESHLLNPTDPQKMAVKVLKNHLGEIYRLNEIDRKATLAKKPKETEAIVKTRLQEALGSPYTSSVTGRTCEQLSAGLPRELRVNVIQKFYGGYQDLTPLKGSAWNASWEDGCTAAIKKIEEDQQAITVPLLETAKKLFTALSSTDDTPLQNLREKRAKLRDLKAHVSALGGDTTPYDDLIRALTHEETFFIAKNTPTTKSICSQSQFTLVGADRFGNRKEGNACHACPFIAGYNILNTLNGTKTGNGEELYLGLARQNAVMETLTTDPNCRIPDLTTPDQALPAFHGRLMPLTIKKADGSLATDILLEEGKEPEQYLSLLGVLDAAATQYGKVGAFIRKGQTFYAVTIENQTAGAKKISIMDSHGFHPAIETGAPPEFVNRAFDCIFPTLEKAADFLAIRTPQSPTDTLHNQATNQCEFYPVILKGQPAIRGAPPSVTYKFDVAPSTPGTPAMDIAADQACLNADMNSRYTTISSTNLSVASTKQLLRLYLELSENTTSDNVKDIHLQNIKAALTTRHVATDDPSIAKIKAQLAKYDDPEFCIRKANSLKGLIASTNLVRALSNLIEFTELVENTPSTFDYNPIIESFIAKHPGIDLTTPDDTSLPTLRKKAQAALASRLAVP